MNRYEIPKEKNRFILNTPREIGLEIAHNLKKTRKRRKLSQTELAAKSGVSYGSLKRFEQTGEISLQSLLKIAVVLNEDAPFSDLLKTTEITSIQQIIARPCALTTTVHSAQSGPGASSASLRPQGGIFPGRNAGCPLLLSS